MAAGVGEATPHAPALRPELGFSFARETAVTDLNAMGHLAGMQQRRQLAEQQARIAREQESRDRHLAAQQAEVVRLLREQQDKEEAEKARRESLPKCPECISPVPTGAKRCPQCRIEIVSWDYVRQGRLEWRLICRPAEAHRILHERCSAIASMAGLFRDNCLHALTPMDSRWQTEATQSHQSLMSLLASQNHRSREALQRVLKQWLAGALLSLPEDDKKLTEVESQIEAEYPESRIASLLATGQAPSRGAPSAIESLTGCFGVLAIVVAGCMALAGGLLTFTGSAPSTPEERKELIRLLQIGAVLILPMMLGATVRAVRIYLHNRVKNTSHRLAAQMSESRCAALADLERQRIAISDKWKAKLEKGGYLKALSRLRAACDTSVTAASSAWAQKQKMDFFLDALVDTSLFSESIGITFNEWPRDVIAQARVTLTKAPMSFPAAAAINADGSRIDRIMASAQEFCDALASLPVTRAANETLGDDTTSCSSWDFEGLPSALHAAIAERSDLMWCITFPGGEPTDPLDAATMQAWLAGGYATGAEAVWRSDWPEWRPVRDVFPDSFGGATS